MKVVLDTNILISAFISPRGVPGQIVRSVARFYYVTSDEILIEFEKVIRYPHIVNRYGKTQEEITEYVREIRLSCSIVAVAVDATGATSDPKDDMFVACALSAGADYIVSGDRHLLSVKFFGGTEVIPPSQFITLLDIIAPPE